METEKRIRAYVEQTWIKPSEEKVLDTVLRGKKAFYVREQERLLTYREFLWGQFLLIRKRWWFMQIILLLLAGVVMQSMQIEYYARHSMGIVGVLFIVLIIPEIWKNRTYQCMEIEISAYYSLNRIYAARILFFGVVDILFLTVFCAVIHAQMHYTLTELVIQFLLPAAVTACICFGMFSSRRFASEGTSVVLCIGWSAVWWLITVDDRIYGLVALPVWSFLLGMAVILMGAAVYKAIHHCRMFFQAASSR